MDNIKALKMIIEYLEAKKAKGLPPCADTMLNCLRDFDLDLKDIWNDQEES